jgi:protein TonB
MNKQKQTPVAKLQKSSVIFMQLGLILALFVVYVALEHRSFHKVAIFEPVDQTDDPETVYNTVFEIEKKKVKKLKQKKVVKKTTKAQKVTSDIKVVDDNTKTVEEKLFTSEIDPNDAISESITSNDIGVVDEPEEVKELPFTTVEIIPTFPGCTGTNEEKTVCFNEKMKKHVNRKFNIDLAQELGLSSGKKRIDAQFVIDEKGNIINLRIRAPHKRLEKETKRIINLLPTMIPGRQRNKNVKVRYNLPITFNVLD